MNSSDSFLYTGYFYFDCIKNILMKNYGNEISFEKEDGIDTKYTRIHSPMTTILCRKKIISLAVFNEERICRDQLNYLVNKLKTDDETVRRIEKDCSLA